MKINKNDILSRTQFVKVIENNGKELKLIDLKSKMEWSISSDLLVQFTHSTEYKNIEHVSKTKLSEILNNSIGKAISVVFNKMPKPEDYIELAYDAKGKSKSKAQILKEAKKFAGEQRTLTCTVIGSMDTFGRLYVLDLSMDYQPLASGSDNRFKQVDCRTLIEATIDGIRYIVK